MARLPLVTLLTDFGTRDPYVAAMKGVILSVSPRAQIVDISHEVPPHDILAGAFVLAQAAPYFPPGTVHVAVVDPGVGTERRILAVRMAGHVFLVPDNGLITLAAKTMPMEQIASVRNSRYLLPEVSRTFHGRDIFAPVAGHILNGLEIRQLGPQPETFKLLEIPEPAEQPDGSLAGQVIYVDRFGDLVSNIPLDLVRQRLGDIDRATVTCAGRRIGPIQGTYEFVPPGELLAVPGSAGCVEIAVNRGSAAEKLQAGVGAQVRIEPT